MPSRHFTRRFQSPAESEGSTPILLLFFITLKPRVERYTKSMGLKYELASEPLHISVKTPIPVQTEILSCPTQ